jgi:hypothetical protein
MISRHHAAPRSQPGRLRRRTAVQPSRSSLESAPGGEAGGNNTLGRITVAAIYSREYRGELRDACQREISV